MNWKRNAYGGLLGLIGYLLSPLSWWNDAFVNLPLAFALGWLVSRIHPPALEAAVIVAYWLTNVAGLMLLRHGLRQMGRARDPSPFTLRGLLKDFVVSLFYTLLIVLLLR